ncbi:hypothetical protein P691DRAFT_658366 [Macrolepiota fuliginosa MF-IS2]|uniref:Uncharacterized protein n=1 Tax=Macrolepiota fuliginosa MF-IS2 TaxID=1400762 RepID=A0A9P6C618_9AGAR|nr:hypothetical protein P691DRAFT_658366 [Macrolepiota fuliginosa MF-IS2]
MLVEDDFPLCGDEAGRNALRTVMKLLEEGREGRSAIPTRRGAFIGTGGSGLVFHRSLLPILIHILRTHADISSKIPPNIPTRPADVVLQDCLLGHDPLCPPEHPGGLIITSRLVMDHIGGMFSTNTQKAANSDKWRCGWRHAFHGMNEVDVVVVDDLW